MGFAGAKGALSSALLLGIAGCFGGASLSSDSDGPPTASSDAETVGLRDAALGPSWAARDVRLSNPNNTFGGPAKGLYETPAAVNPTNPLNVIAFAIDLNAQNEGRPYSANHLYRSEDGGASWIDGGLLLPAVAGDDRSWGGGDSTILFTPDGTAYHTALDGSSTDRAGPGGAWVFRSKDGGATWETLARAVPSIRDEAEDRCVGVDKQWLAHDARSGRLYLAYTEFAYRCSMASSQAYLATLRIRLMHTHSADGGVTWTPPRPFWNGYALGAYPQVGPDGTLHVAFWSSVHVPKLPCPDALSLAVTRDQPFSAIVVASSPDGGGTWTFMSFGTCRVITPKVNANFFGGTIIPTLGIDREENRVLLAWPDFSPLHQRYVVRMSQWTATAGWTDPTQVTPMGVDAFTPTLAVHGKTAWLSYYALRDDERVEPSLVESADGGKTWGAPFVLSTASSRANSDFGDYMGLDYAGGRLVATWTDSRGTGAPQIYARYAVWDSMAGAAHALGVR